MSVGPWLSVRWNTFFLEAVGTVFLEDLVLRDGPYRCRLRAPCAPWRVRSARHCPDQREIGWAGGPKARLPSVRPASRLALHSGNTLHLGYGPRLPFQPSRRTRAEPSQPSRNGRETPGRRPLAEGLHSDASPSRISEADRANGKRNETELKGFRRTLAACQSPDPPAPTLTSESRFGPRSHRG